MVHRVVAVSRTRLTEIPDARRRGGAGGVRAAVSARLGVGQARDLTRSAYGRITAKVAFKLCPLRYIVREIDIEVTPQMPRIMLPIKAFVNL